MCGRFSFNTANREAARLLNTPTPYDLTAFSGDEIAPGDTAAVLEFHQGTIIPRPMRWGFPHWQNPSKLIFNARAETAMQKALFRRALQKHPVIIPTTGFYEWRAVPDSRRKDRFRFLLRGQELLYLAGFYDAFRLPEQAHPEPRFTILTRAANESVRPIHDRMPVVLLPDELESWLYGCLPLLKRPAPQLVAMADEPMQPFLF